ncbi:VCBS repeat-containing protein [Bradyrhizobium sp. F1.4.3]|uniref:VCBS domain-containing protein n=1 Tax=Bradyrhizobium sp. F1.4.3 TaxID=3156356 RepID=UPI0033960E7B
MNYAGKFDAALSLDGQGFHSPGDVHVDSFTAKPFIAKAHGHLPEGAFVVPDPNLIFNGEFKRAGGDLVLSHDGHEFVVHDYFRGDKRAAIASPDGAHLTGDVVNALTGHVEYAQAAPGAAAAQVIGHVTKLVGSASTVRNGVSIVLNNGDNVEKGDVVSTGGDSTLGITFIDGTVFGLSSNARMVLNEMVYDPNGSNNSSLLSLVAGTITFVAGETAKHGDMKIDTPVATMGIRGTAVLTQINFVVPPSGGDPQPQASFQVLVEPNGTTGSYILFDKLTLLPIATVNQAGQMIQISGGNVSISNALVSPDVQKLITDVFTLKFTDNNTNTKLTTNFTDSITQTSDGLVIKTAAGYVAIPQFVNLTQQIGTTQGPIDHTTAASRIPAALSLFVQSLDLDNNVKLAFNLTEVAGQTGVTTADVVIAKASFIDLNRGDRPTVTVVLTDGSYVYKDSAQHDVTAGLSALQKQDVLATEVKITVVPGPNNDSNGFATWIFSVPDNAFDFLAAGETLTLKYTIVLNNNFVDDIGIATKDVTVTVTGTNDKPVITSSVPTITFEGGTSVPGGPLASDVPTSGALTFKDVDLTDTHTVSVKLTSASLPDGTVPPGPLALFQSAMSVAIANGSDSTGSGTGTINWSLADLPVYLADFIPKDEVLTLVYTVTVTDSQGATSQQTITVTITGTDAAAVVWIATNKAGAPSGGFWKDAANWETGTVPTISDDVIVITDQLHGLTPSYPVTIDAAAYAKSITMNDFGGPPPKVINQSSLTIAGALNMSADSIFTNAATGTMSVGGKAEILDTAVFTNAGYLTLAGGGDLASGTTITNSGTIELSGGTLKTLAEIHNAGGTLKADVGTTLIVNAATVDGGTVTIAGTLELDGTSLIENGTLNNSGAINVNGTVEFAHETASNTSSGTIKVLANGWLTIDQGSTVANDGNITVDAGGKLTVNGATISGGAVKGSGTIDVTGASKIDGGATLSTSAVLADAKLTLDGITVSGSTITDNSSIALDNTVKLEAGAKIQGASASAKGAITNTGTLEIAGAATLLNDVLANTGHIIQVDDGKTLTLSGTEIIGGAINNYNGLLGGTVHVTGDSRLDGNATLSKGAVTVDAGVVLTLDDATVSAGSITNGGTVKVDVSKKLTLAGASLTGGVLTIAGTLASSGTTTVTDANISNSYLLESTLGGLLALVATTTATSITNDGGTIRANNAELDINGEAVTNTGTLAAINDGTLKLISTKVTNTGGGVSIESGSTLDLSGATIDGGSLTIAGTLESTGTSAITEADITNTGTITVTSGKLTIDPAVLHTLTNSHLIQANGGELDISGELIVNTADIQAIGGGILKLTTLTVTNDGGTVTVDATSKLYLTDVSLNDGQLNNAGHLYGVSGSNGITAAVANTGTIEVQAGTLNLSGGLSGIGTLIIENNATLELGGADAQTVTFAGGTDTLKLDNVAGQSFTGTITGRATAAGTFKVTGDADITASKGDALDFTASGGTSYSRGDIVLTPTGALTGADNGIVVTQNGIGDVSLTTVGDVIGLAGDGIVLHDGATGAGDITATIGGAATGAVGLDVLANGDGDVTITNNGHVTGTTAFGISVDQDSTGATGSTHVTNTGSVVGADGHAAISIHENTHGSALIDNFGTIGPDDAGTVVSTTYAIFETGGTITINNTGDINGNISVASATFNNESSGTWTVSGTSVFGALSTIDNDGVIDLHGGSISGTGLSISNSNEIYSWGTASISGTITNTGTIEVNDGTLKLFGSLSGAGSVTIDAHATLEVSATVSQTITFSGDYAELQIDTSSFGGSIAGLAATDKIDLSSIEYGLGTSAVYVSNAQHTGGVLTVTDADGHHISLTLVGDYRDANFAGSDDGTGHTLITLNAADDAPKFVTDGASLTASVYELADKTNDTTPDPSPAATGSIDFKDIDLTDLPTAKVTGYSVTGLDGTTALTLTPEEIIALENALSLQQTGKNNGTVSWSYSIADSALDFLGENQTAMVVSTITLDDGHKTDTAQVTVAITGANDAPTLDNAMLASVAGNNGNPGGDTVSDLFTGKFHDVDDGASFKAIAVTSDAATATEGVWQYEVAGTHQWVDIGSVSDTQALVLGTDTLIRFVPADGFTGTPDPLGVHALDNTYTGAITHSSSTATIDITGMSTVGTAVSDKVATISTEVTAPVGGPVIDTDSFQITYNYQDNSDTLTNLTVTDTDPGAATDTFTVTAVTGHSGTYVTPGFASGSLSAINPIFQNGGTYEPGPNPPATEQISLTVTDSEGRYDTVHFIFNKAGDPGRGITLEGTNGKDVIFATSTGDTLIGGGGKDQFVFAPNPSGGDAQHTVNDFDTGLDKIDLRQFSDVSSINDLLLSQQADGTLITWEHESILLKNVTVGNLHANDFIITSHAGIT